MKWIILIALVCAALPVLWLGGGVFQEPPASILSAAKMEWRGDRSAELEQGRLLLAGTERDYIRAWEEDGWTFVEQLGSGYVLSRDGETLGFTCRAWGRRYRICT